MWNREGALGAAVTSRRLFGTLGAPLSLLGLIPALLVACAGNGGDHNVKRTLPQSYVEGSFVVTASAEGGGEAIDTAAKSAAESLGCSSKSPERISWGEGAVSEELAQTYNVKFENCDFSQDGTRALVDALSGGQGISAVEPEALATSGPVVENDDYKSYQGHLPFIRRDKGCEISETSEPVIVAVVDSGVDFDHPDLKDAMLTDSTGEIIGANFVGSGATMPPDRNFGDGNGHGTHVAGLIAASANNGQGVVGVASCANVKIMPIRVLGDNGKGSSIEIDRGVRWAAEHGAQVINMSLGYLATFTPGNEYFYRSLYNEMRSRDVAVFAAAGNDGMEMGGLNDEGEVMYHFPSSYDGVYSIAATNNSGSLTSFSNRGKRVDFAVPGSQLLSTIQGGDYGRMSGTSMASPVAAGAYALALATARAGLTAQIDRVDLDVADRMLDGASSLSGASLPTSDVTAGAVLDVEKLVGAMAAKYPKLSPEPTPVTPVDPNPVVNPDPVDGGDDEEPAPEMTFVGLKNNQTLGTASMTLKVQDVPEGTYAVYYLWSGQAFARDYVEADETVSKAPGRWFLYGTRTLSAIAIDENGNVLKTIKLKLKGQ
jgi:subtilisin family serine protease